MRLADSHFNRLQVLRELRRREPVSRTELTAATGLNAATISAIVGDLVARGIVVEQRIKPAGMGRPRLNLRLAARTHCTATAVITGEEGLRIGIADLRGEILHSAVVDHLATTSVPDLARQMAVQIGKAIAASGIPAGEVRNVQVGLPAVVDRQAGVVHYFETFPPGPVEVRSIFEAELGLPTSIDHAMNLLAACEHWYENDAAADDFMLVTVDLGIASSAYRKGVLHSLRGGLEAEFGHIKVFASGGRPCRCGGNGCLETYASISAILGQMGAYRLADVSSPAALYERFAALALPGGVPSAAAAPHFAEAGAYLGTAIANLVNLEAPERIVVLVPGEAFAAALRPSFEPALERDIFPPLRGRTEVVFRSQDPLMYIRGGAALTLERLYEAR